MNTRLLRRTVIAALLAAVALAPAAARGKKDAVAKDWRKIDFPELPAFEIPKPVTYTLDNGMRIFLMEDDELPLVSATLRMRMGSNHEPADKVGLASIYGAVLRDGGTLRRPADEVDEWLAARAASIEAGVGGDSGTLSANCLSEDFPDVLRLMREFLAEPALPQDKIDLAKTQEKTTISRRNDDVGGIVGREFAKLVRGEDSPLGRTTEYTTIAAIERSDLVAWHERYVHPNNLMLGIVGDFDVEPMKALIAEVFGGWEAGAAADMGGVPYREEPRPGLFFIEKTDITQANIRMGHLGIRQDNPDYFAVQILNEALGGGFTSRMFGTIRTDMGLAYSVFGGVGSSFLRPGLFQAGTQTKSESVTVALDAMKGVLQGIIDRPPTDEEIARAKDSILQSFVFNYASKRQVLAQQMNYAYYGLPSDYLERYRANIEAVTKDQVAEAARKYIHPDRLTVLVAGNPADFDRPLSELGEVTEIDIAIPPPPSTAPEVVKNAASLERGGAVFDRVIALHGGDDASSISGYRLELDASISMQGQQLPIQQSIVWVYPDRMRTDFSILGQQQSVVLADGGGFMMAMGQTRDLPPAAIEQQMQSRGRDVWFLVTSAGEDAIESVFAGSAEVDGTACDRIQVTYLEATSTLCVDPDGRVLQQTYDGNNPLTQAPGTITSTFSDFRDVDGVPVAFKVVQEFDGEPFLDATVQAFELNPTPDEGTFAKP
jgi:predicted Zn-dependent peptidase